MKLVVKQHRPVRRATIVLGFLLGAAGAVAVAFHYGQWNYILASLEGAKSRAGFIEEKVTLERKVEKLGAELAKSRRSNSVDQSAKLEYQRTVTEMKNQLAELKQELAFYREIFASSQTKKGPQVGGFRITDFDGHGRYQYRLVLTHVTKDDRVADGSVSVEFRGKRDGRDDWVRLSEISEPGADPLAFQFKHFRRIEGILAMPAGFAPSEVYVAVHQKGQDKVSFNHVYKWASLVN